MSPTVVTLPSFIVLRSQFNNTLLRYVKEEVDIKGWLQFHGEHVSSPEAKFEVHKSGNGNGLVHIRSCYNNKYLVMLNKHSPWIVAKAEKPEEDQSKFSCTLLRPYSVDWDPTKIRLTHVYLNKNLAFWEAAAPHYGCVYAGSPTENASEFTLLNVIDWETLVFLPQYVAFKGDNDKFLRGHGKDHHNYLQFGADNMEDNPTTVGHEIIQISNGNIRIRSLNTDQYWRATPRWIWADSTNPKDDFTEFKPIKIDKQTIALRNVATNDICKMRSDDGKTNCLDAGTDEIITSAAKFKVSELVLSRKIENVRYRLTDARIYDETVEPVYISTFSNDHTQTNHEKINETVTIKTTTTWSSQLSLQVNIETTIKTGIPCIANGKVKVGLQFAGQYSWGEAKEDETEKTFEYTINVPPKKTVNARITARRVQCDVPYSYSQHDLLYSGETVITDKDDGLFTGKNNYSCFTELKEEPLIEGDVGSVL
ncbi:uncharacterized protein LOC141720120 [Apium graveolens]|uniref:uncharacterized protein LOC141720120 n=1 Tax=Apium graveolens TaxID=4045 RepID=UPI003D78BA7A